MFLATRRSITYYHFSAWLWSFPNIFFAFCRCRWCDRLVALRVKFQPHKLRDVHSKVYNGTLCRSIKRYHCQMLPTMQMLSQKRWPQQWGKKTVAFLLPNSIITLPFWPWNALQLPSLFNPQQYPSSSPTVLFNPPLSHYPWLLIGLSLPTTTKKKNPSHTIQQ